MASHWSACLSIGRSEGAVTPSGLHTAGMFNHLQTATMMRLIPFLLCSFLTLPAQAAPDLILPPMVSIPAGEFLMGSNTGPTGDGSMQPLETPVHSVRIKPFQLSAYEVTVGQFRQFVQATGHKTGTSCWKYTANDYGVEPGTWDSAANAPSEFHPVMCVSWLDAKAYAAWLSKKTGSTYRLPSEAEWEYAGRAGSTGEYAFGNDVDKLCRHANLLDLTGKGVRERLTGRESKSLDCDDGAGTTSIVGMYLPNAFGLYDMTGNVGEFVEDCQHASYDGAPADGSAWTGNCKQLGGGDMVIHRGGNYGNRAIGARIAMRGHAGMDNYSSLGEGFRLAMDGPAKSGSAKSRFDAELAQAQQLERQRRATAK